MSVHQYLKTSSRVVGSLRLISENVFAPRFMRSPRLPSNQWQVPIILIFNRHIELYRGCLLSFAHHPCTRIRCFIGRIIHDLPVAFVPFTCVDYLPICRSFHLSPIKFLIWCSNSLFIISLLQLILPFETMCLNVSGAVHAAISALTCTSDLQMKLKKNGQGCCSTSVALQTSYHSSIPFVAFARFRSPLRFVSAWQGLDIAWMQFPLSLRTFPCTSVLFVHCRHRIHNCEPRFTLYMWYQLSCGGSVSQVNELSVNCCSGVEKTRSLCECPFSAHARTPVSECKLVVILKWSLLHMSNTQITVTVNLLISFSCRLFRIFTVMFFL